VKYLDYLVWIIADNTKRRARWAGGPCCQK